MAGEKKALNMKAAGWQDYVVVAGVVAGAYTVCRLAEEFVVVPAATGIYNWVTKPKQIPQQTEQPQAQTQAG